MARSCAGGRRRATSCRALGPAGQEGSQPPAASSPGTWPDSRHRLWYIPCSILYSNSANEYENLRHEMKRWCNGVVLGQGRGPPPVGGRLTHRPCLLSVPGESGRVRATGRLHLSSQDESEARARAWRAVTISCDLCAPRLFRTEVTDRRPVGGRGESTTRRAVGGAGGLQH